MNQNDVLNAYRTTFPLFATKAFNILNPGVRFTATGAYAAMAYALSQVTDGSISRLLITVPPRSGKSLLASVALPAYLLGRDPSCRIIAASYSGELASKLGRDCRTVMNDPAYTQLFPATKVTGKNTEFELETAHGGFRYATSVGGTLTGRGGNYFICDDPVKPEDALSRSGRERAWEWFTGTATSRLDNKAEGAMIVVMQRLHDDDLAGRLIRQGGWQHLRIPAIASDSERLLIGPNKFFLREPGEVIDPVREPKKALEQLRSDMGSAFFQAQYQQDPVPDGGTMIKREWLRRYKALPAGPGVYTVQSWDIANASGTDNDYSVCTTWVVQGTDIYLKDAFRVRLEYPLLKQQAVQLYKAHRPTSVLIECAANGVALAQELQLRGLPVKAIRPEGDKVTRMSVRSQHIEQGKMYLPTFAPWLGDFETELLAFPNGRHDDQVDTVSQILNWLHGRYRGPLTGSYSWR